MEKIAKRAGASSKTIYSRFPNKEAVLRAVVRRMFDLSMASDTRVSGAGDPRRGLRRIGRDLASLSAAPETAGVNRLIMSEAFQVPELGDLFVELHERATELVQGHLIRWAESGLLSNLPEPRHSAMLFVEMTASLPRLHALLGRPLSAKDTEKLLTVAVDVFLGGCGYEGNASESASDPPS